MRFIAIMVKKSLLIFENFLEFFENYGGERFPGAKFEGIYGEV